MHLRLAAILIAILIVGGCAQSKPDSPRARGMEEFKQGRWSEAIAAFSDAIAKNPLDTEAYLYRGQAYLCSGRENVNSAIADYNEAIRLNPQNYEAYYHRAIAYKERGDRQQAIADELKARQLDPNAARAGTLYSSSMRDYEATLESLAEDKAAEKAATEDDGPSDMLLEKSAPENRPLPGTRLTGPTAESADPVDLPANASTDSGSGSPPLRDAFGLPLAKPRAGSVTEELFGLGAGTDDEELIPKPRFRQPSRKRKPSVDWEDADSDYAAPRMDVAPPAARRSSPIGTLPYGNPYQAPMRGYSPYSPTGPRSTGLQGDPTLRGYQQSPGYQSRNPYAPPIGNDSLPPPGVR